ncbi:MAG: gliding motility protein GldM [Paludibacteraceae bacterium]|nr:gliding motility protein GldM [Paludibacteraceae bacterium]
MMYLVYTALLALNVSTDVLNGFTVVQKSLSQSIETTTKKNASLIASLESMKSMNATKIGPWLDKAMLVRERSQALIDQVEDMKYRIISTADGVSVEDIKKAEEQDGEYKIQKRDNLDVPAQVALNTAEIKDAYYGQYLKDSIDAYAAYVSQIVSDDEALTNTIQKNFDTSDQPNPQEPDQPVPWLHRTFDHMPVVAVMTLLTKVEQDIRNTEADVISHIISLVDAGDFRVNKISAEVIPDASYVTRGGKYRARIILAAVDSTQKPEIIVNGKPLEKGEEVYTVACGSTGKFPVKGEIKLLKPDGTTADYPFESEYIVGEPTAIISADMMNVFYAGIDNPVSISVPGVAAANINATSTNGTLVKTSKGWSIKPIKVGQPCNISVSAKMDDGKVQAIGGKPFRVKALPPPMAYIEYQQDGVPSKYKGGKGFSKAYLVAAKGIKAELDDADLDVKYQVLSFDLNYNDSMGNTLVKTSKSTNFTDDQRNIMRGMAKGKRFFISQIRAKGPDGIERVLPPIEVIVN